MIRIATLVVVVTLALTAASPRIVASAPPSPPAGNVDILVNGAPLTRYAHRDRWYVEAVKGREYEIRLRNPYGVRVAIALSVDGLNTIDAQQTTAAAARKWVLEPYETVTISGWQTSQSQARRFEFTTEENSYAEALGKASNLGVISAVYFRERVRKVMPEPRVSAERNQPQAAAALPPPASAGAVASESPAAARDEYAATGMGRPTDHVVTQVWVDLEDTPAQTVDIRYEFRPQLVRLGILPQSRVTDPLQRREGARGFEPGFSPEPPRKK